ncbi:peptide ABC transporter substrate-binding protein [Streptomyces litchfieldiae]|uniref:ABC transporter substrate-binding protein n=1 Tax=Streptomyces litchfieldiae TaxID=3075543 RepID=A0ABU2MPA7_9ACTN|nr:ABC transporter substrate-binding protein [Streptomyces sp. DSM 44938]MDT0342489.1 ABC transporter substrate-binding protein [Streptomyces sp. DSM 44938]
MRGARSAKWVASAIVVALAATACGGGDDDEGGNGGDNAGGNPDGIVRIDGGEPQNPLIPTNTGEQYGALVIQNVFSKLVDFTDEGEVYNVHAESVTPNEDNTVWTVKLQDGWTFHNGDPVTAENYVNAWNWAAHIDNNQANGFWFSDIVGYEDVHPEEEGAEPTADTMSGLTVVDDLTFEITLSSPVTYYDYKMGYDAFTPLPDVFFDDPEAFGEHPIGNGPYEFVEWNHNESIELARYDEYAGENKAQNGGIHIQAYTGLDAAYQDLRSGNLDIIRQVDPKDLPVYQDDLGDRAVNQPYNGIQTIVPVWYEWEDTPPEVLQGISMSIDRETITTTVLNGSRTPADSFVAPGVYGYQEGIGGEITSYDPERGRQLVEDNGGVPNNRIVLQYNADGGHQEWVEAVCNNLIENLGVECVGDAKPDFDTDLEAREADEVQSMYRGGWFQDYPLNANFMKELYHSTAHSNYGRFNNEEVDALFDQGDAAADLEGTVAAYQEAEQVLFETMPAIPLWYQNVNGGWGENVENVRFNSAGQPVLTEVTVNS